MNKNSETKNKALLETDASEANVYQSKLKKRKKIIALVSVLIAVALFVWLAIYLTDVIFTSLESDGGIEDTAKNFKEMIQGYGSWGWAVAFGIQVLQVVVSPIPGEFVEVGMGLCFGWFGGTVLCMLGGALAAWIIMLFVKKLGVRAVELFVPLEKINELKFINNEKKLSTFVFILYMIPGTPKDPLIFFFGLTKIKISNFVVISTIARIPSIVTSTIGGEFLVNKNYLGAILIFAITGAVSVIGLLLYKKILEKLKSRSEKHKSQKTKG
jgi:uncharacterized membrane protein YdjX (TVP38/TMEM64 family)